MNNRDKQILSSIHESKSLEIDYEKLADALIKAEKKASEMKSLKEESPKEKRSVFKAIWSILKGEKSEDGRYLSAPYIFIIVILYKIIAVTGLLLLIPYTITSFSYIASLQWSKDVLFINIIILIILILVFVIVFLYMMLFLGAANDMENEKDKDYVMNVFTGLVSIVALVISIIAISH